MAKEGPNWDGLLKWSIAHSDGTRNPRNLSEEDRKWFTEAMQAQTIDVVKRMKEITFVLQNPDSVLEEQGVTATDLEDMLDELQEHVESIDMANDFNSIGGLTPLLKYLKNSHPNIRAKAAEVVSTIVQNNPKTQQLVMEANGMEPLLLNFTSDDDVTVRTKALGAISYEGMFFLFVLCFYALGLWYVHRTEGLGSGLKDTVVGNGCGSSGRKDASCSGESGDSLTTILSDPITGTLMDDAMILRCGHSFGSHGIQHVMKMKTCYTCSYPLTEGSPAPNLCLCAFLVGYDNRSSALKFSMGRRFGTCFQLIFRILKALLFLGFLSIMTVLFAVCGLTISDIFAAFVAFLPTGWAFILVS